MQNAVKKVFGFKKRTLKEAVRALLASFAGLSIFPLLLGLIGYGASLTPSLIPRTPIFQGVLAGTVAAFIYLIAYTGLTAWRHLHLPMAGPKLAKGLHIGLAIPVLVYLLYCLIRATTWQNSIRIRMEMEPADSAHTVLIFAFAALTFLIFYFLGEAVQKLYDVLRARLYRHMARRTANVMGAVLAAMIVVLVTRDGVISYILDRLDHNYAMAQNLFDASVPPADYIGMTGADSLLSWPKMGEKGRNFITSAPRADDISSVTGLAAKTPIRIYVGRAEADSASQRAALALKELIRVKAFERKVMIVAMPTGTGWLDPANHDALEVLHGGDIATIAVQYSYLQSPLSMLTEPQSGLDQGQALLDTIYAYWSDLPKNDRPKLFLTGISLGAWSSMHSVDLFKLVDDPINGALWAGPPFPSKLWNQSNEKRKPDSSYVLPVINDSKTVRYISQYRKVDHAEQEWGRLRIVFLQYASDPIVFFSPGSILRKPQWLRESRAPDVSPYLRYVPLVTNLQLIVDMMLSTGVPYGFGHNYAAADYIDAWISISEPEEWSATLTERLKSICDTDYKMGCVFDKGINVDPNQSQ